MAAFDTDYTWNGRIDSEETKGLAYRIHELIKPLPSPKADEQKTAQSAIAIIGFCSDEGVARNKGRIGARNSPNQLRNALANLPWSEANTIYDAGNISCENNDLDAAHQNLADKVNQCLAEQHLPVVLGGGHEVAFGSWLGLNQHLQAQHGEQLPSVGIINLDAHFDLRKDTNGPSSGTPFYQIAKSCKQLNTTFNYCCLGVSDIANTQALFQRADELNVSYRRDSDMGIHQLAETLEQLEQFIDKVDLIYLTIDLDVLPACVMPGVSAPAALGVDLAVIENIIKQVKASGKLRLADMAEYNPEYDIDNRSARVAARLFHLITA